jgi:hypothetical protein
MVIIKESYASYENNGFTLPVCRQWRDEALNNAQQFLKMQLFWAALTPELLKVVAQRNPNTMTLDDMYQIAMDTQREAGPKIRQAVAAINPENEEDDEVAAFKRRKGSKNVDRKKSSNQTTKPGSKGFSSNYKSNSGPGSNANRNSKYCFYYKLQNHTPEECFKRIRGKKPCLLAQSVFNRKQ